jgi:membrane protein implicated in regulation of membrane protease activity
MSLKAMPRVSVDAHIRYILATDAAAFLIGVVLLCALSIVPKTISALALWLLIAGLAAGLGMHVLLWFYRGIRSMELSDEALTVYRGRGLVSHRCERRMVTNLRVTRRLGRRAAVLLLTSRERVRITEDAFPQEAFGRFLNALCGWGGDSRGTRPR